METEGETKRGHVRDATPLPDICIYHQYSSDLYLFARNSYVVFPSLQMEVVFKTWKSLFHIHRFKPMKGARFQCHLYGTLIALLISSTVMFKMREWLYRKQKKELSEYKAMSMIKEFGMDLFQALWCSEALAVELLLRLCDLIARHEKKIKALYKKERLRHYREFGHPTSVVRNSWLIP